MSEKFMQKVFETYKADHEAYVKHGKFEYSIAHNPMCTIHTWIIRREVNGKWEWLCPLPLNIW